MSLAIRQGKVQNGIFRLTSARNWCFFCTIIVARLLTPEDFGLAAISMTLDILIWLIISFGINSAIIHFEDNMEERLNAAFWLFIAVMGGFSAVIIAASPLIARFYNAPIITPIFQFSAIALFIYSFGAVHKAILYRQMDFKQASILDAVLHTLKYVLFVAFAFAGFRVWSFIYPKVIIALICVVCLWKMTAWKPKLELGLKYWREMFNYGKNVLAGNILDFLFNNSTHLLIGNIVSPAALGIYSFANDKAIMMVNNIAQPATMMSFPAYSRMQGELDKLKEVFIKTIRGNFPDSIPLYVLANRDEQRIYHLFLRRKMGSFDSGFSGSPALHDVQDSQHAGEFPAARHRAT